MAKAVIYLRVSTKEQAETKLGLDGQERACRLWCEMRGHEVEAVVVDPGVSAAKALMKRPAGKDLEGLLREGMVVVASKLDRMFRSMADCVTTVEGWSKAGVKFACLDIGLDTSTPVGEMVMGVVASIAQFERRRMGERMSATWEEVGKRGGVLGPAPYGLKNTGSAYRHEEVEEEAGVVEKIRGMLAVEFSYSEIARTLNQWNVRTRTGKAWTHTQVARVAKRIRRVA